MPGAAVEQATAIANGMSSCRPRPHAVGAGIHRGIARFAAQAPGRPGLHIASPTRRYGRYASAAAIPMFEVDRLFADRPSARWKRLLGVTGLGAGRARRHGRASGQERPASRPAPSSVRSPPLLQPRCPARHQTRPQVHRRIAARRAVEAHDAPTGPPPPRTASRFGFISTSWLRATRGGRNYVECATHLRA
jgi:hypothetical protein